MLTAITQGLQIIDLKIFLISILFFLIGYALAPWAYARQVRILTAYPLWIAVKLEKWVDKKWPGAVMFLFIFSLNTLSLTIDLFSGMIPILPFLFAVWTGLNIGVVSFHTLKGHFYYASLINPVALIELPAAFLTFTMAIQYNLRMLNIPSAPEVSFIIYWGLFLKYVLPLLFIAAIIETAIIRLMKKEVQDSDLK